MTKTLPYLAFTCALGLLLTGCSQSSQGLSRVTPSAAPDATIVAVHMDAVNHMTLSREELAEFVQHEGIDEQVLIPADGESLSF